MTVVEHRAVTPDGKVLQAAVMADHERWSPDFADPDCPWAFTGKYAYETRVLPDGEWRPAAVVYQSGRRPVVITSWTL